VCCVRVFVCKKRQDLDDLPHPSPMRYFRCVCVCVLMCVCVLYVCVTICKKRAVAAASRIRCSWRLCVFMCVNIS